MIQFLKMHLKSIIFIICTPMMMLLLLFKKELRYFFYFFCPLDEPEPMDISQTPAKELDTSGM